MKIGYDWLFYAVGGAAALLGVWLLYWSLLRDRARGRRRCPKCWYEISPVAFPLTCSECGYVATRERKLRKTRRRWKWTPAAVVLLMLAAALGRGPMYMRGGFAASVPTTALIFMLPWIEDHHNGGGWRGAMMDEFMLKRVGVTAAQNPRMWGWQWRWICERGLRKLEALPKDWHDWPGKQMPSSPHWAIMACAAERQILHRSGLQDRFAALLPPTHLIQWQSEFISDGPVRFTFNPHPGYRSFFTQWPQDLQILLSDGTPLRWQYIKPPSGGEPRLPTYPESAAVWMPQAHGAVELEIHMDLSGAIGWQVGSGLLFLPRMSVIHRERKRLWDSEKVLRAGLDLEIERLIRKSFSYELDLSGDLPSIRTRLSKECVLAMDHFGSYVWSIEILRDGQTVFVGSRRMDVLLTGDDGPWGSAMAEYPLTTAALTAMRAAAASGDEAQWSVRFAMDRHAMIMWTSHSGVTYWDGFIEQPIAIGQP